ncbi:MAG: hypothetical protein HZA93_22100 [Verrucomicrobia bacterium]|nr:hypothetical protein [Verrucomicrobiota bacterium]
MTPRRVAAIHLALALSLGPPVRPVCAAATAPPATGAVVELPPMLVEESVSNVPWLYLSAGGTEFLSRCSAGTTREIAAAWLHQQQLLRVLVPDEFLVQMDVPAVFVLYSQDLAHTVSAEIQRELTAHSTRDRDAPRGGSGVNIAPSMRLADRDMHASIAYVDEALFDGATLRIAASHVRYLLKGRVPELPAWLAEGLERAWPRADFVLDPITLAPMEWLDPRESDELAGDRAHPRALLPAGELLAPEAVRVRENQHARRQQIRAAQQELFFRWAVAAGGATRDAFWKFAARAAEAPADEAMFESCFGFDFAELRDRLSDHLPKAVKNFVWIAPGRLPPLPRLEVEAATPNQIARVRGEWERLAIGYVQKRLPSARDPYLAQARRTLQRAYAAGDRDPRLLATLGLCEVDAGNDAGARPHLEAATAGGVVRPRAYFELARIRFAALRHGTPETKAFSFTELAPVMQPLQRTLTQAPPLHEAFTLLAEAWARCDIAPSPAEFAELQLGARLFARQPTVGYPTALALARHGRKAEAAAVLEACAPYPADEETRAGLTRLRTELAAAAADRE